MELVATERHEHDSEEDRPATEKDGHCCMKFGGENQTDVVLTLVLYIKIGLILLHHLRASMSSNSPLAISGSRPGQQTVQQLM
jgi:hypothetical protein